MNSFRFMVALAATLSLLSSALGQESQTVAPYTVRLLTPAKSILSGTPAALEFSVSSTASAKPAEDISVQANLAMPSMSGMAFDPVQVTAENSGMYRVTLTFPHPGEYRLTLEILPKSGRRILYRFKVVVGQAMGDTPTMEGMHMSGAFGKSANREGSGTSWQPDEAPMFMKMLPTVAGIELSAMGSFQAGYVDPGTKRVGAQSFTDSMFMLMGRTETGGGALGLDFMTSLDPIINGKEGVPDVFQTGETAYGAPLVDRQHPHNLFSELAASYSHPLSENWSAFIYGGPVGEPALGNVMFMHRASGMEIPEAPITHHWFDSTHISFGTATVGLVYRDQWKAEASWFNGHEPGENRYEIGPEGLNSGSARLSYNPCREWSFSTSYGYIDSPEALSPGINEHRLTVSAAYSRELPHGDNFSATAYFGRNIVEGNSTPSDGWLAEATYFRARDAFFMRFERVDKDELYNVPPGDYAINKLVFGDVHNFYRHDDLEYGFGAYAGVYSYPGSLDPYYGKSPLTLGVFFRLRPGKM